MVHSETPIPPPEPTWQAIVRLLRWDKPTGRLILMIPALWAVVLATDGRPPLLLVGIIVVGSFVTSAAGCVVNDLWDRNIDPQVERTRSRPLASRALSVRVGIAVMMLALLCAWGLTWFLNPLSFWLCVAAVPVILLYPLAKRVFPVPQLVLAIAWGFAVLIPWSAATQPPALPWPAWLLWGATVFWTLGFDTVYAMADRYDDRRIGVNSSALFFGRYVAEAIAAFYAATVVALTYTGLALELAWPYWITLAIAAWLWFREYRQLAGKRPPRSLYGQLFRENVQIGFLLLLGQLGGCWL